MNDRDRAAGRGGVGTVMGSKDLKAVVVRGSTKVQVADRDGFDQIQRRVMGRFREAAKAHPSPPSHHGTLGGMVPLAQKHGVLPTKNHQRGTFDGWQAIRGQTLTEKYLVCWACPIACGRVTRVTEPPEFAGAGEGPEMVDDLADRSYRRRINSISKSFGQSFPVTKRRSRAAS